MSDILKLIGIEQYIFRGECSIPEIFFTLDSEFNLGKEYLILLSNERGLEREPLLVILKNILKYLRILPDACTFAWVCLSDKGLSFSELCNLIQPEKIFSFGVNLDFKNKLNLHTLDLSNVLLQPTLKRQVFEDVSRLLFSSVNPA